MASNLNLGLYAGGTVPVLSFVKMSGDFKAVVCSAATDKIIGISTQASRRVDDPGNAATIGEELPTYGPGQIGWVVAGAAFSAGDILTSDANGAAIVMAAVNANQYQGARALQAATAAGQIVKVLVWIDAIRNTVA